MPRPCTTPTAAAVARRRSREGVLRDGKGRSSNPDGSCHSQNPSLYSHLIREKKKRILIHVDSSWAYESLPTAREQSSARSPGVVPHGPPLGAKTARYPWAINPSHHYCLPNSACGEELSTPRSRETYVPAARRLHPICRGRKKKKNDLSTSEIKTRSSPSVFTFRTLALPFQALLVRFTTWGLSCCRLAFIRDRKAVKS